MYPRFCRSIILALSFEAHLVQFMELWEGYVITEIWLLYDDIVKRIYGFGS